MVVLGVGVFACVCACVCGGWQVDAAVEAAKEASLQGKSSLVMEVSGRAGRVSCLSVSVTLRKNVLPPSYRIAVYEHTHFYGDTLWYIQVFEPLTLS